MLLRLSSLYSCCSQGIGVLPRNIEHYYCIHWGYRVEYYCVCGNHSTTPENYRLCVVDCLTATWCVCSVSVTVSPKLLCYIIYIPQFYRKNPVWVLFFPKVLCYIIYMQQKYRKNSCTWHWCNKTFGRHNRYQLYALGERLAAIGWS